MAKQTQTTATIDQPTPVMQQTTEQIISADDLAYLKSQRKALDDQIRAATPKLSPLDKVIAHQANIYGKWQAPNLALRIRERMAVGQEREQATAEVVAFFVAQTNSILDRQE